jgi:hypothetical protein
VAYLDFPPLMVEADQFPGRAAAPVQQRGDQPVAVPEPGPVGTVHVQAGLDDPHPQAVDPGQVGPVGQDLIDWRLAGGAAADQEMSPGPETSFIRSAAS